MVENSVIRIQIDGEWRDIESSALRVEPLAPDHFLVWDGNTPFEVFANNDLFSDGHSLNGLEVKVESQRERIIRERFGDIGGVGKGIASGIHIVKAPMPGMVRAVPVRVGDAVERHSTLVVLEAMKMENNILAGMNGRVIKVHASEGTSVEKNGILIEIEIS